MNIVWIMSDHFRADALSCMGNKIAKTPNIDALAARGVLFENAFAQSPLCCPSRTCFFASRYAHAHDVWWNGIPHRPGIATLPQVLRERGYRTGLIGKLHFYPQHLDHGFDHIEKHEECMPEELNDYHKFLAEHGQKDPWASTEWLTDHPQSSELGVCNMPEEFEETRWAADRAGAFIRENAGSPFFLCASFIRPHSPWNPLPKYLEMYKDADIEPAPFDCSEWEKLPPRAVETIKAHHWDILSATDRREMLRHYYALCSQVDANVGRIVHAVEEAGIADDTIIVFAADHGDFMSQHRAFHKMHLWDGSLHIPLVVRVPGKNAARYSGLVESIDLAPTLLNLLGEQAPEEWQGRSLVDVLDDPTIPHRDAVFAEYVHHSIAKDVFKIMMACIDPASVSIRTNKWKYIHYPREAGELYDIENDPGERRNLYFEPGLEPVLNELKGRLLDWRTSITTVGYPPPSPDNPYFEQFFKSVDEER